MFPCSAVTPGPGQQDTVTGIMTHILRQSGPLGGLYRGMAANFLKVAPAVSISYVVNEHVRCALGIKMNH